MKYTKELLEPIIKQASNYSEAVRMLQPLFTAPVYHQHLKKCIKLHNIDVSHFNGLSHRLHKRYPRIHWSDILIYKKQIRRKGHKELKDALLNSGRIYQCIKCDNNGKWNNDDLTLEIDHINEIYYDNRPENLQFLCPNCHAQKSKKEKSKLKKIKSKSKHLEKLAIHRRENIIKILNSSINFSKHGYLVDVGKLLNITPQRSRQWLIKNMSDFYKTKCWKSNKQFMGL